MMMTEQGRSALQEQGAGRRTARYPVLGHRGAWRGGGTGEGGTRAPLPPLRAGMSADSEAYVAMNRQMEGE